MKEIDIKIEALIGKLLDGEDITPVEQQMIDDALQQDAGAKELFEQMQMLRECSRDTVTIEIDRHGSGFEELMRCVTQPICYQKPHAFKFQRHLRFITGLAAGFILGLLLHFALPQGGSNIVSSETPTRIARNFTTEEDLMGHKTISTPTSDRYQPVIRNVDWYRFTDGAGKQWLVQGVREGVFRPVVYNKELY